MPERIQRRRTPGWRMPDGAVYVGRPTVFGNPYHIRADRDAATCVALYREWLDRPEHADLRERARAELAGHDLACWCGLDRPCHADVLLEVANPKPGCANTETKPPRR